VKYLIYCSDIKLHNQGEGFCDVLLFKSCTGLLLSKRVALDSQPRSGMILIVGNACIHNKSFLLNGAINVGLSGLLCFFSNYLFN
jgi:hypothetical protein